MSRSLRDGACPFATSQRRALLVSACTSLAFLLATPAAAQSNPNAGVQAGSAVTSAKSAATPTAMGQQGAGSSSATLDNIGDIIVTARRRDESIQKIPVAITALSEQRLQRYGITSLEQISATTPELVVTRGSSGSGADLSLRGIGSSFTSIGIEQSVAVNIDGVYVSQGRVINQGQFDMRQVEILKGPQALFFGKNATAGVISFKSNDPGNQFEYRLRAEYEFKARQPLLEAVVSGPVTDTFGLRLAVSAAKMYGGYSRNVAPEAIYIAPDIATGAVQSFAARGSDVRTPQEKQFTARLTAKYEPTEDFTATVKAFTSRYRSQNATWNEEIVSCPLGGATQTPSGDECGGNRTTHSNLYMPPEVAATDPIFNRHGGHLYQDNNSYALTALLSYKTSKLDFDIVSGFLKSVNYFFGDYDYTSNINAGVFGGERVRNRAFSTEIRVRSKLDGSFNFLIGGYYQKTKLKLVNRITLPGNLQDSSVNDPGNRYQTLTKDSFTDGETISAFGQAIISLADNLEFTAGARYSHETKDSIFRQPYVVAPFQGFYVQYNPANPATQLIGNQTFNNFSPEATLSWNPTSTITTYISYKRGFKSGGFSIGGLNSVFTTANDLAFGPEKAKGFEGGVKTTLMDGQLRLNLAAYTYTYSDLQIDFLNAATIAYTTFNAGSAKTSGVELEANWSPRDFPGFSLHATASYNDAHYSKFPAAPCYGGQATNQGCNLKRFRDANTPTVFMVRPCDVTAGEVCDAQNLAGTRTARSPRWVSSLQIDYQSEIGSGLMFGVSGNGSYRSRYLTAQFGNPRYQQSGYITFDATARVGAAEGKWEVAVIAKNITNKYFLYNQLDALNSGPGTGTPGGQPADAVGSFSTPRTVSLRLTLRN